MGLIVQKFGGTSVANAERLRNVAQIIADTYRQGNRVVAVLSAQGDSTDDLIEKAREINPNASRREMDMLLSTGEQISCALCAMADAMYAFAEEDKRCRVVSASVGSVSETYAAPPELCAETIQSREGYLRALAQDYLVFGRYASGGVG